MLQIYYHPCHEAISTWAFSGRFWMLLEAS